MSNGRPPASAFDPLLADVIDDGTSALTESASPAPIGLAEHEREHGETAVARARIADWRGLGFAAPPRIVIADGRHVFRVWGGASLERGDARGHGVFFSFTRPTSRRDAERLFAILEYGNACTHVTEFEVPSGTPMFVGPVDPGDDVHPALGDAGEQVFIRNPWAQRVARAGAPAALSDDLEGAWVYTGEKTRDPGTAGSH